MKKSKVIIYDFKEDSSNYLSSYEEAAKLLGVKASKLKRIADTDELVNNRYYIRKVNNK